jgi:hypothetical protein
MNIEMYVYGGMDHGQMVYGQILKWMKVGEHRRMEIVDGTEMYEGRDTQTDAFLDLYD